jgi:hypothetical protein
MCVPVQAKLQFNMFSIPLMQPGNLCLMALFMSSGDIQLPRVPLTPAFGVGIVSWRSSVQMNVRLSTRATSAGFVWASQLHAKETDVLLHVLNRWHFDNFRLSGYYTSYLLTFKMFAVSFYLVSQSKFCIHFSYHFMCYISIITILPVGPCLNEPWPHMSVMQQPQIWPAQWSSLSDIRFDSKFQNMKILPRILW